MEFEFKITKSQLITIICLGKVDLINLYEIIKEQEDILEFENAFHSYSFCKENYKEWLETENQIRNDKGLDKLIYEDFQDWLDDQAYVAYHVYDDQDYIQACLNSM